MSGLCSGGNEGLFALVAYVPEPLAGFVNRLRHELSPGCRLRAHITVLPPRTLSCETSVASREMETLTGRHRSFRIEVDGIKVFAISNVIYLSIGSGADQLRKLHKLLNQGRCLSSELWPFEPHLTLAQDLEPAAVAPALALAEKRWREYAGPRDFTLDRLTFVQGIADKGWMDLAAWELPSAVLV